MSFQYPHFMFLAISFQVGIKPKTAEYEWSVSSSTDETSLYLNVFIVCICREID